MGGLRRVGWMAALCVCGMAGVVMAGNHAAGSGAEGGAFPGEFPRELPGKITGARTQPGALPGELQQAIAHLNEATQRINALQSQVAQLEKDQNQNWMTQAQAEQVKALVREVLADSKTRATLLSDTATAGYDQGHFFLASPDGSFKLNIEGQIDFRYIYNNLSDPASGDKNVNGFQLRRTKLGFFGHIGDPRLSYKIKAAFNRSGGIDLEDGWIAYDFDDHWQVKAGQYTEPFLREFIVSSTAQQAVERSSITQYFTGEFTKGVTLSYKADRWRALAMISGGPGQSQTDYTTSNSRYEWGLIGRGEVLLAGNWKEFGDFAAWSDDPFGVMVGGAVNWSKGANFSGSTKADLLKYAADISAKLGNGINLFGAFVGQHVSGDGADTVGGDQYGIITQAGVFVLPDKLDVFGRYEYADLRGAAVGNRGNTIAGITHDTINMLTVGTNYYFKRHNAKATLDLVYAFDPIDSHVAGTGSGILPDMDRGEIALRAQFQLLF